MLRQARLQRLDVLLDHRPVLRAERLRHDRHLVGRLQVLERRRVVVLEIHFARVEHVEHDQVIAEKPQRFDRFEDVVRLVVEIRDEEQDAAALEVLGHLLERLAQVARPRRFGAIERVQHDVEVLRRRRHVRHDLGVERHDADPIALLLRHVGEARAEKRPVLELRHPAAREPHRLRDVEQNREVRVGVGFVLLDVEAVGAREQAPVDAPDVVARHVAAVLGEVDRRAEIRRTVQAVDEPVDDRSREQIEAADPREDDRVDESCARDGRTLCHCLSSL